MPKEDTQFKPGQSGNPGGRPKGTSITAAIMRNLTDEDADEIAKAWIREAKKGKRRAAIREALADRIDGKPRQAVEHTGEDGGPVKFSIVMETNASDGE